MALLSTQVIWTLFASYLDQFAVAVGVTNKSSFFLKFSAGSAAGALGSIVGNPFDVLKTVMS